MLAFRSAFIYRHVKAVVRTHVSMSDILKCPHNSKAMTLSKIVATIGPASEQLPVLQQVVKSGMRIMRLNFSHATYEEADLRTKNLKLSPGLHGSDFNLRAIMLDTQGPEIRTGSFADGVKEVQMVKGETVTLTTLEAERNNQTKSVIWISYKKIPSTVKIGDSILLDDGAIELSVIETNAEGNIFCRIVNTGTLGNKKGVNLPGLVVDLPAMCDKDKIDIRWGIQNDIDFIAASFTRKASDVREIRAYTNELMREFNYPPNYPLPKIIAKIENIEALDNFDDILAVADGIMVARGDLGVEIPMETLTNFQKLMVRKCNEAGKAVVVATQMLESMQKSPRPTRAECTDVANAIYDGADCVMLSGESAKGKYPVASVDMMQRIVLEAERFSEVFGDSFIVQHPPHTARDSVESAGKSIVEAAKGAKAACIIAISPYGKIAKSIGMFRPNLPIVCVTSDAKTGRQLQIHRCIHPVLVKDSGADTSATLSQAVKQAIQMGFCVEGDTIVIASADSDESSNLTLKITKA